MYSDVQLIRMGLQGQNVPLIAMEETSWNSPPFAAIKSNKVVELSCIRNYAYAST